jgi:molecular chaperone GrpE
MTDDKRHAADEEVVEAELVEDEESSAGPDSSEKAANGDAEQVERDLDELQDQRRPQTPPPDLVRERDEYLQLAQRTKADFENFRRRAARDAEEAGRRAKAGLARELLPALDSLERALQAAGVSPDGEPSGGEDEPASREVSAHEALAEGVSLVLRELRGTLARAGVEAFDPTGEAFDPSWHEALSTRPADGASGKVLETLEKGYRLDGQLIRPARVIVGE